MQSFDLNDIGWQEVSADGTCYTLLEGDKRDPTGGFSYLLKLPPGAWDRPHWHTGPARLLVLRGELRLGLGTDFKPEAAASFPAGSMLYVPAHEVHFDGCDVETLVFGVAQGPWATLYVDPVAAA
jgi:quercetin dioxygenase-like cupin family protein